MAIKSDFDISQVLDSIRNGPIHVNEEAGFIDEPDLILGLHSRLALLISSYEEKGASREQIAAAEASINSSMWLLMRDFAARHNFRLNGSNPPTINFSNEQARGYSALTGGDRLIQRLCELDVIRKESRDFHKRNRACSAAAEVLRAICGGRVRLDEALSTIAPLVNDGFLSIEMALSLLVPIVEKTEEVQFFDHDFGWLRVVETIAALRSVPATELYWNIFLRRMLKYSGGVEKQALLLRAIRECRPYWSRALRAATNTKYIWPMDRLGLRLRFHEDGKLCNNARYLQKDETKRRIMDAVEGIVGLGLSPGDFSPMRADLIEKEFERHAPASARPFVSASVWSEWARYYARAIQFTELANFVERFMLSVDDEAGAWAMRIFLSVCGGPFRAAAINEIEKRGRIARAAADGMLPLTSLKLEELIYEWNVTREKGSDASFLDYLRAQSQAEGLIADRVVRSSPIPRQIMAEPVPVPEPLPTPKPQPQPQPKPASAKRPRAAASAKPAKGQKPSISPALAGLLATFASVPPSRKEFLAKHEAQLRKLAVAADARPNTAAYRLTSFFSYLVTVADGALTQGSVELASFAGSVMGLAAQAGCLLIAREIRLGLRPDHSRARVMKHLAARFSNLSKGAAFSMLSEAIDATGADQVLKDAEALNRGEGYDALGSLGLKERKALQSSLKGLNGEAVDLAASAGLLAAHWNEACSRLQRVPAFDDAFLPAVNLLNDVVAADAKLTSLGKDGLTDLLWKARRTWAVLALRNRMPMHTMEAAYECMKRFKLLPEVSSLEDFRAGMEARSLDEVPVTSVVEYYAADAARSKPAKAENRTVSGENPPDENASQAHPPEDVGVGGSGFGACGIYPAWAFEDQPPFAAGVADALAPAGLAACLGLTSARSPIAI